MQRAKKGSVSIGVNNGWLRLRWTHQGKPYQLQLGLPNEPRSRKIAEFKKLAIEGDIRTNNFDSTLKKYKPEVAAAKSEFTVSELFVAYAKAHEKEIHPRTFQKYRSTINHLETAFNGQLAYYVGINQVEIGYKYFTSHLSPKNGKPLFPEQSESILSWFQLAGNGVSNKVM